MSRTFYGVIYLIRVSGFMAEKIVTPESSEENCEWCQYDYSDLGEHFSGDEDDKRDYEQHLAMKKLETYLRRPYCCAV